MAAEHCCDEISVPALITALLRECSAVSGYRTLRDRLPGHLAALLKCRCVLLYQRVDDALRFVAGSTGDQPDWSYALLGVAHINPLELNADLPEARAWREQRVIATPVDHPIHLAVPLLYCHQPVGVLVALRQSDEEQNAGLPYWRDDELPVFEAVACVAALLLEHARLLEQDHERIHELSLLNDTANQLYGTLHEPKRMRQLIVQRACEITNADLCDLLLLDLAGTAATVQSESAWSSTWLSPACVVLLRQECRRCAGKQFIVAERPGNHSDPRSSDLLACLPLRVKTFFAVPLLDDLAFDARTTPRSSHGSDGAAVQGIIVGAYCDNRKLRNAEIMLLRVLAGQASAALSIHRLQEEKRRLDHLASLGTMAAGVAHEVRNPLAGIKYSMQMLIHDIANVGSAGAQASDVVDDIQASIAVALQEIERLDGIVHDLLSFAKPRQPHYTRCDLPPLIDRVLHLLHTQCTEAGVVVERIYHPVGVFWADRFQIEQVLLNLVHNAIQAMSAGGTLTVSCRLPAMEMEEDAVSVQRWVELAVSDTGCGIAQDRLEHIFQPFVTTRAHGIGLGLSITRRLIEDHSGRISVESGVGQGTTVTVWLPLLVRDPASGEDCFSEV